LKKSPSEQKNLSSEQIEDLKLAAAKMRGGQRREFVAQMTNKYCQGSARKAERVFGWKRNMVELGLAEQRTGIKCVGAQSAKSGVKRWEEQQPVKRLSLDCKATVVIGDYSRGGKTRGDWRAQDHDMGRNEKYIPVGIIDEDSGQLYLSFGSSHKTSDLIVDTIERWWLSLSTTEQDLTQKIQIKVDNGSESSGVRTQFLYRMVEFAQRIGKSIQLLYYPPYHSKYNPIERCWGILEQHWNGAKLIDKETMLAWAQSMTWKGIKPIVHLSIVTYATGISLSKSQMKLVEQSLERNPELPKWDILIHP
jgi:hypothetical protein